MAKPEGRGRDGGPRSCPRKFAAPRKSKSRSGASALDDRAAARRIGDGRAEAREIGARAGIDRRLWAITQKE